MSSATKKTYLQLSNQKPRVLSNYYESDIAVTYDCVKSFHFLRQDGQGESSNYHETDIDFERIKQTSLQEPVCSCRFLSNYSVHPVMTWRVR